MMISSFLLSVAVAIEPMVSPQFVLDFDLPASRRYDEVFEYYKEPMSLMEDYFYHSIPY